MDNPVGRLESGEKPHRKPKPVAILEGADLTRLLEQSGVYRPLFEFLAYTGLRISEALGLRWGDVDFDAGLLRVRRQLARDRRPKQVKTHAGNRDVVLSAPVARILHDRLQITRHQGPEGLVFCDLDGRGLDQGNVRAGFRRAVTAAGISGRGRLSPHSLRHTFASLLIANGLNVMFVSRQLGHAKPTTTLAVYAHLYAQADHANTARAALQASHHALTDTRGQVAAVETVLETHELRSARQRHTVTAT